MNPVRRSSLSTELFIVPVQCRNVDGSFHNPTADIVSVAFPVSGTAPSTFYPAAWDPLSSNNWYYAEVNVGPAAAVVNTLARGTYNSWVKVADNPEVPAIQGPDLILT